jgi:hypothetical protein
MPGLFAKLYQANEMLAVMPKKRMPHPHLYDRMVVAGVTPDFFPGQTVLPGGVAGWEF